MMNKTELKRKFIQLLLLFSIPINATSFDLAVVRVAKVPAKALYVTQPEGEKNRLFVVNQKGLIHIIENGEVESFVRRREWSEKRESNPRPRAWEARTLPTELFSLKEIWQGIQCKTGH